MDDTAHTLTGAGFDAIYTRQIEPELQRRDGERKKALRTYGLIVGASVILAIAVVIGVKAAGKGDATWLTVGAPLFIVLMAAIFGYLPLQKVGKTAKQATIETLCGPLNVTYAVEKFEPGAFAEFVQCKLLPAHSQRHFEDQLKGHRNGREFEIYEATLQSGAGKNQTTVFSGQLFRIAIPRTLKGTTILKRDGGWLNSLTKPKEMVKIPLDDPKHEKMFEAFADDEMEGRSLLNAVFIETVAALEQTFGGKRARCAFLSGQLLIAIEGNNRFGIGSMFTSLVNRKRIEKVAADIEAVFRLIDAI